MGNILPTKKEIINHFNPNIKDLLIPRFEVIANYPNSKFEVNQVIEALQYSNNFLVIDNKNRIWANHFPHIFKKLNWWEKRKVSEMPEYLKQKVEPNIDIYQYEKIIRWEMDNTIGVISDKDMTCCDLELWSKKNQYLPATKEEYEAYQG